MNLAHRFRLITCLGCGLLVATEALSQSSPLPDQIKLHEQTLAQARAAQHRSDEGIELITLGYLYRQAGQMRKALEDLNQALTLEESTGNQPAQAMTENTIGRVYSDLGQQRQALSRFNVAVSIWRNLRIRQAEANTLTNIGRAYNDLGQRDVALKELTEALDIWHLLDTGQVGPRLSRKDKLHDLWQLKDLKALIDSLPLDLREAGGRAGEANTLDNLGETYTAMGKGQDAFKYFSQAIAIWREVGELGGEALTLNSMGRAYADLGQKQKSLDAFNQALSSSRKIGNRQVEALTLNNTGRLYRDLGQNQTAMDYYNQALPIWREVGNRIGEGLALNDIGRAYADKGQPQKALDYGEQALPIWRETGTRRGEAMTLNNMGRDCSNLGETDKALEYDTDALPIWHEVEDRRGEALAMMTIGWEYSAQNKPEQALASELAALSLAKSAGDPEIQGGIETSLMIGFRDQHRLDDAIFFGMDAVSAYQQIRKNISEMEKSLQAGFAQSKSTTYRILAELLIQAGRLGEAEEILDLLKEQELMDIVHTAAPGAAAQIEPLKLTAAQLKALSGMAELEKSSMAYEQASVEAAALKAKATRTPDEDGRLKQLSATMDQESTSILSNFTATVHSDLEQNPPVRTPDAASNSQPSGVPQPDQSYLQNTLAKLGPHVLGVRLLLGQDHAYEIVVTSTTRKKFQLQATPADLRAKALEALKVLRSRNSDPRTQLAELYAMLVAPIEDELMPLEAQPSAQPSPQIAAPTLLWSLDDALRYLPIGALYDGHRYMVERFNNVLFTPESYGHMSDPALTSGIRPSVLAMGLSKSYGGLPPLPGVMPELDSVVHDPAVLESHGPMEGKLLPDERFTLAALKSELTQGNGFSVVHIASHFVVETGNGDEPYLMLGGETGADANGYQWNLSDMEDSTVAFHGTRLLTLSACSTARDYTSRNGLEMDSLGMVAQQKDAEAVLATLWDVNDASTSRLMSDFYGRWVRNPAAGKAEALRQAQLAFLQGSAVSPGSGAGRGFEAVQAPSSETHSTGNSHPFYWAPFVLIGNFQ